MIKNLKIELHKDKSKIISLSNGIDFIGFRNFWYHRLLRRINIRNMENKIEKLSNGKISKEKMAEIFRGWNAYSSWADTFNLRLKIIEEISDIL